MRLFSLVWVNLRRNWLRTILTAGSVSVAIFLFCALQGVLDTLDDSIRFGSETRLVTRNAISLVFPMPLAYEERIRRVEGVKRVAMQNWFGGVDPKDPKNFFAQFAVEGEEFFRIYRNDYEIVAYDPGPAGLAPAEGPDPKLSSFFREQTACIVGQDLMEQMGWKLGQTVTLRGTIYPGEWPFTIRAVYASTNPAFGESVFWFHWNYLYEKTNQQAQAGVFVLELDDPSRASEVASVVDAQFENSAAATRTETERAFQAGFVSMYGNIPFLLGVLGTAVVFAILLVAANTMMMAVRERTGEFAVLKTLGFDDGTLFRLVLLEGALLTLLAGAAGALGAKFVVEGTRFDAGGFLPPMTVHWETVLLGLALAALIGAASGLLPAWQVARLQVVEALRRVE